MTSVSAPPAAATPWLAPIPPHEFVARLTGLGYTLPEADLAMRALARADADVGRAVAVWWTLGTADPALLLGDEPLPLVVAQQGYTVVGGLVLAVVHRIDAMLAERVRAQRIDPILAVSALEQQLRTLAPFFEPADVVGGDVPPTSPGTAGARA